MKKPVKITRLIGLVIGLTVDCAYAWTFSCPVTNTTTGSTTTCYNSQYPSDAPFQVVIPSGATTEQWGSDTMSSNSTAEFNVSCQVSGQVNVTVSNVTWNVTDNEGRRFTSEVQH